MECGLHKEDEVKCLNCGGRDFRREPITQAYTRGNTTLVIKNIDADVCAECGTAYLDMETANHIYEDILRADNSDDEMIVRDYGKVVQQ
jgi:YgiT-type zinc finger domain-containing protein